jgi:hypothetical protein
MAEGPVADAVVRATYLAPIVSAIIAFTLGLLAERWSARRPRLLWFWGHNSSVQIPAHPGQAPLFINSHSVAISNTGRGTAHNVCVNHTTLQGIYFRVFPITAYVQEPIPGAGGERIRFHTLVAGSSVWIHYVAIGIITDNIMLSCEGDEGAAKSVNVGPQRIFPRWIRWANLGGFSVGVGFLAYWAIRFGVLLVHLASQ